MNAVRITIRNIAMEFSRPLHAIGTECDEGFHPPVLPHQRDAVGRDARRERLRRYVTWPPDDLDEFNAAQHTQRVVDPQHWR